MAKESEIATQLGLKQDPEPLRFLAEAGFLWLDLRNFDEAARVFEALCVLAPDDPIGPIGLGDVERMRGNFREALALYDRAAHCGNNAARSLAMIFRKQGEAHALAKDSTKAIAAFERAITLDPNSDEAATARDYIAVLNRRPELPTVSESESKRQN